MGEIAKTLRYELETNVLALKKFDTWIFLSLIIAIVLFLLKEFVLAVVCLLILLILDAARSHSTGQVTDYFRKKYKSQFQDGSPK